MKAFWNCQVREVSAQEVKHIHKMDRTLDSKMRLTVKQNLRDDGVTSNLFPLSAAPDAVVHRYELTVTRAASGLGKSMPISAAKGWRSFSAGLRRFSSLPPMVRVDNRIYSAQPLQQDMLELPKEFHDIGWASCKLEAVDSLRFHELPPAEYRTLVNKLFPWSIGLHALRDGSFSTARESDGKIVCTHDGLTVAGLRIYRGTTAHALFIDADGETVVAPKRSPPPKSAVIKHLEVGTIATPVTFRCVRHDRTVVFKGSPVDAFTVEDASGTMTLSAWNVSKDFMKPGHVYTATNLQVRSTQKNNVSLTSLVFYGSTTIVEVPEEKDPGTDRIEDTPVDPIQPKRHQLALRLDTKCLVASERSLLDEVQQHFGSGPFAEDVQRRIARVVQGTPIVVSTNLRHASVRVVKFDLKPETVQLEPALAAVQGDLLRGQPYAILQDHSVVPLQALHCCFDPKMRTWQDVTVATCSFVPQKRVEVLSGFRTALEQGLSQWGLQLASQPFVSHNLAILEPPVKEKFQQRPYQAGAPKQVSMPTSILFCSIANDRTSQEDREKNINTAQHLAKEFRSPYHAHCASEVEAAGFLESLLMENGRLRDPNSAVVFVSSDRDSRATRWLVGESLRRGVLPVCIPGVSSGRRQALLTANIRVNLRTKFEQNPLKGLDLVKDVPNVANKNVLSVGIDCCNNPSGTIGAAVGVLSSPSGNKIYSTFWRNTVRGREVEQVAEQFGHIVQKAMQLNRLDEIVVLQDGNVFSELQTMKKRVPVGCGLTFMCLHKRTNIRFLYQSKQGNQIANASRGTVIQSHTPAPLLYKPIAPSFYMQSHECPMSTARCVEYTIHAVSETLEISEVQKLSHCMSHVFAPLATKLPLPTRCAHRLGTIAERIIDASPDFQSQEIPDALGSRMWFL